MTVCWAVTHQISGSAPVVVHIVVRASLAMPTEYLLHHLGPPGSGFRGLCVVGGIRLASAQCGVVGWRLGLDVAGGCLCGQCGRWRAGGMPVVVGCWPRGLRSGQTAASMDARCTAGRTPTDPDGPRCGARGVRVLSVVICLQCATPSCASHAHACVFYVCVSLGSGFVMFLVFSGSHRQA